MEYLIDFGLSEDLRSVRPQAKTACTALHIQQWSLLSYQYIKNVIYFLVFVREKMLKYFLPIGEDFIIK